MFGKKKKEISVQHYEGLSDFSQDYPCKLIVEPDKFIIKKIKPDVTVTLPRDKINNISAMEESKYMLMYHGDKAKTNKFLGGKKYYLVITYDTDKRLAFWGTSFEYGRFLDLQYNGGSKESKEYTL